MCPTIDKDRIIVYEIERIPEMSQPNDKRRIMMDQRHLYLQVSHFRVNCLSNLIRARCYTLQPTGNVASASTMLQFLWPILNTYRSTTWTQVHFRFTSSVQPWHAFQSTNTVMDQSKHNLKSSCNRFVVPRLDFHKAHRASLSQTLCLKPANTWVCMFTACSRHL